MNLTSSQKTLLIALAIMWLLYFFNRTKKTDPVKEKMSSESTQQQMVAPPAPVVVAPYGGVHNEVNTSLLSQQESEELANAVRNAQRRTYESNEERKLRTRNQVTGDYARSSYDSGQRGAGSDWESEFDNSNSIIANGIASDGDFGPTTDDNNFASFVSNGDNKCGSNSDCKPEDLFDSTKYLPQEVNDDWFDTQHEPVSVKNRHLINVSRQIGVSTVAGSHKNSSLDLRGSPACPKFVVSPWLQSSIEPDHNIRPAWN
jgi:hypothetical protein